MQISELARHWESSLKPPSTIGEWEKNGTVYLASLYHIYFIWSDQWRESWFDDCLLRRQRLSFSHNFSRIVLRFSRVNVLLDPFVPLTTPVTVRSMSCGLLISLRSVWPAFDTFSANVYFIHTAVLGLSHFKQLLRWKVLLNRGVANIFGWKHKMGLAGLFGFTRVLESV